MSEEKKKITVVGINSVVRGSTGGVMLGVSRAAGKEGVGFISACPAAKSNRGGADLFIGTRFSRNLHVLLGKMTGRHGCFSATATKKFVSRLGKINPDVLHLHNLHGDYINLGVLFDYIRRSGVPVVWTLHDCWAFTGRCPHFEALGCSKWETGCENCPMPAGDYPKSDRDRAALMWEYKRRAFTMPEKMTIVTPSRWLAGLVRRSFLGKYDVRVINNGVDVSVFRPTRGETYEKIKKTGAHIVLGVASGWTRAKGLDVFSRLSETLPEDYTVVLVGVDEKTRAALPPRVVSLGRTDKNELAEIYSAADVFVNPTLEDTFPTVNIEALCCGTPVVTFDTGGSPEIPDEKSGLTVPRGDYCALSGAILRVCGDRPFSTDDCVSRGRTFDSNSKFSEYVALYRDLAGAYKGGGSDE